MESFRELTRNKIRNAYSQGLYAITLSIRGHVQLFALCLRLLNRSLARSASLEYEIKEILVEDAAFPSKIVPGKSGQNYDVYWRLESDGRLGTTFMGSEFSAAGQDGLTSRSDSDVKTASNILRHAFQIFGFIRSRPQTQGAGPVSNVQPNHSKKKTTLQFVHRRGDTTTPIDPYSNGDLKILEFNPEDEAAGTYECLIDNTDTTKIFGYFFGINNDLSISKLHTFFSGCLCVADSHNRSRGAKYFVVPVLYQTWSCRILWEKQTGKKCNYLQSSLCEQAGPGFFRLRRFFVTAQ